MQTPNSRALITRTPTKRTPYFGNSQICRKHYQVTGLQRGSFHTLSSRLTTHLQTARLSLRSLSCITSIRKPYYQHPDTHIEVIYFQLLSTTRVSSTSNIHEDETGSDLTTRRED